MKSKHKIIWTPEAIQRFEKTIDYIQTNWSVKDAEKFIINVNVTIQLISRHPRMFRQVANGLHEALISPHNLLVYKVYSDKIFLITFFDNRQHPLKKNI